MGPNPRPQSVFNGRETAISSSHAPLGASRGVGRRWSRTRRAASVDARCHKLQVSPSRQRTQERRPRDMVTKVRSVRASLAIEYAPLLAEQALELRGLCEREVRLRCGGSDVLA